MVDVEVDASPLALRLRLALSHDGVQIATIVTTGEGITDAQLEQLCLQLFALGNVDENSVAVFLAAIRVDRQKCAADDGSYFSVAASELKLDVAHRSLSLQLRHFSRAHVGPYEIARAITLQIFERIDAEHLEKRWIRIHDLAVQSRDVDSLLEAQRELAERARITQIAKAFWFPGLCLSGGLGTTHIRCLS